MALSFISNLKALWPFSRLSYDDLRSSDDLLTNLPIPDHTKQFVYAVRDPSSHSVIYVLAVQNLSERSASDSECLIRAVRPDSVVVQMGSVDR
ncbi:hypothetical protein MLD38_010944 [Melastoma candidum]|uniref:Uncharacterized protein n=1 Tax=Melastoma candidum TaxID=119954 RepID=A0ACB9R145_9MYRT|nr:hypothetical protein MLD38_010944 [Melastoma candidum]